MCDGRKKKKNQLEPDQKVAGELHRKLAVLLMNYERLNLRCCPQWNSDVSSSMLWL
jgi:hypothetical protein